MALGRTMPDGNLLVVSDAGLDAAIVLPELPPSPWKTLMEAALCLGRGALRGATFNQRDHIDIAGIEERLTILAPDVIRNPNEVAVNAAIELLVLSGQVQHDLDVADVVDAYIHGRRRNSDGGRLAKDSKKSAIGARDREIRRLNAEIANATMSDSDRARRIEPKLAAWKADKQLRVGSSKRVIRAQIAELRRKLAAR